MMKHVMRSWFRLPTSPGGRWAVLLALVVIGVGSIVGSVAAFQAPVLDYTLTVPARSEQPKVQLQYGSKPAMTNYPFFRTVRDRFIKQEAQFLSVNLNEMTITVYENGIQQMKVPVKAKGKRGSWWETPAGLYKIQTKKRDHVTSFGGLHMPWSMQFHGNFFIHGWPYYENGNPVTGEKSAGCIRLSDKHARRLYQHVRRGTPVLVYENRMSNDRTAYTYTSTDLDINASSYLVADADSHQALARQAAQKTYPMSVTSQLLVGLIAAEHYGLENRISYTCTPESRSGLRSGQAYRTYDLFFPLLQSGSAEAAGALSRYRGRKWYLGAMKGQARALGMSHTTIRSITPSDKNHSSPRDLFALAKYLYNYRSFLLRVSSEKVNTGIYGTPRVSSTNLNEFRESETFVGGVTIPGATDASPTAAVAVFDVPFRGTTKPLVFVVMDSSSPVADIQTLYTHVTETYTLQNGGKLNERTEVTSAGSSTRDVVGGGQARTIENRAAVLGAIKQLFQMIPRSDEGKDEHSG